MPKKGKGKLRSGLAGGIIQGLPTVGSRVEVPIHQCQVEQALFWNICFKVDERWVSVHNLNNES